MAESRAELRQLERDQGIARQMDQQFQQAEQLAQMANQESRQLMEELEAELQRNPAMQQALSEIARNTLQDVKNTLEFSAQEELNLQRANERADAAFQSKKRELAAGLARAGWPGVRIVTGAGGPGQSGCQPRQDAGGATEALRVSAEVE